MASNSYLGTRVAILKERLLPESFFTPYITAPLDTAFSQSTGIPLTEDGFDSAALERSLMRSLLLDLAIIRRPLSGSLRDFFTLWAQRFELFNLKTIIRSKYQQHSFEKIEPQLQEIPWFSRLPHNDLLQSENLTELLRHLEKGAYRAIAAQARRVFESEHDPHAVEVAIDQHYYTRLNQQLHKLPEADRNATLSLLGRLIDKLNLSWLVRYRFTYELSPSECYYHLIHFGKYLKRDQLLLLSEQEDFESVLAHLPDSIAKHIGKCETPLEMEQHLEHFVRLEARNTVIHSRSVMARALAYLMLRECDLNHIRTLLMGKSLNISGKLLQKSLGHRADAFKQESEYV